MSATTQNIEECLKSETACLMLANSEFLLLFDQAAMDRAKLLYISDTQMRLYHQRRGGPRPPANRWFPSALLQHHFQGHGGVPAHVHYTRRGLK